MESQELHITIPLNPVTKKNSQQIVYTKDGRPFILPSKQYKDYERESRYWLSRYRNRAGFPFYHPVEVTCLFYRKTRHKVDLTNLLEAIDDILVKYGVLDDDNSQIIVSHDGSRVLYDKDNPRTEIYIRRYTSEQGKPMSANH